MTRTPFLIAALVLPLISSCGHKEVEFTSVPLSSTSPTQTVQPTPANPADLEMIRKFAESYEPKSGHVVIPDPPNLNEKLLKVIAEFSATGCREHEKFIILIFLRLSRFQIEHFKQRYELGRENPLTKEFYRLIDKTNYEKAEIVPAYLADYYVEEHQDLLAYPLIGAEMRRIEKAGQKIQKELDDTTKRQASRKSD